MELTTKLAHLVGVGDVLGQRLEKLGLITVEDLVFYYPFRYDDFSNLASVQELKEGEVITIRGQIWSIANTYTRSRKVITKAILNDGSGAVDLVWFNQSWLTKSIPSGSWIQVSGKINKYKNHVSIMAPEWEKIVNPNIELKHTGRLVPVYSETFGLTSKWLRNKIHSLLPRVLFQVIDPLPDEIKNGMVDLATALAQIHFPESPTDLTNARARLSFDELFYIQLATIQKRLEWKKKQLSEKWQIDQKKLQSFIKKLPFTLTDAQIRALDETIEDLKKTTPMNRLIQGEVGSGKTVVAAVICYLAFLNKLQVVFMAPTEILAFQHHQTLSQLLEHYGISVGIYTGSKKQLAEHILVGTHALLSDKLQLNRVGLVVVDEQQRFGVEQRTLLRNRSEVPHFLTMTATPIPRTVALTLYGDLDLSIIDQLPQGRKAIKTHFVPNKKRLDAYNFIKKEIHAGRQAYIITPLIEESETNQTVKAAKVEFEKLTSEIFPNLKLGLLHGRLPSKEKERVINEFKDKKIDILVSTSVVEVGVDVPNATIMLIEGAERFGLAQLHQLRGRVGRGEYQSYTFLFVSEENPMIINRLKHLETISNGLALSELDLKIRGSGELFGTKQSGRWNLKIADLTDLSLIESTRTSAQKLLSADPQLDKHPVIKAKLAQISHQVMPD